MSKDFRRNYVQRDVPALRNKSAEKSGAKPSVLQQLQEVDRQSYYLAHKRLKELEDKISSHKEEAFSVKMHQVTEQSFFKSLLTGDIRY